MERKLAPLPELKLADDAEAMVFSGYGARFGNLDARGDVIAKGAFADSLKEARRSGRYPAMLLQHGGYLSAGDMMPIGLWTELEEDAVGLRVTGRLADTARAQEVYALMKMAPRPAIDGLSIGYRVKSFEYGTRPGEPHRILKKIDLFEISLVTFPANDRARVDQVKSLRGLTARDAERALREAGFSRSEAKALVAGGFPALPQRDADGNEGAQAAAISGLRRLTSIMTSR